MRLALEIARTGSRQVGTLEDVPGTRSRPPRPVAKSGFLSEEKKTE